MRFDVMDSPLMKWMCEQPEFRDWAYDRLRDSRLIVFNADTREWRGGRKEEMIARRVDRIQQMTVADVVEIVKSGRTKSAEIVAVSRKIFNARRRTVYDRLSVAVHEGKLRRTLPQGSYELAPPVVLPSV